LLDFNNALDAIGAVTKKYYRLRHPGMALGALTPIVDPSLLQDVLLTLVHRRVLATKGVGPGVNGQSQATWLLR